MIKDVLSIIHQCLGNDEKAWKLFVKTFAAVAKHILSNAFDLQQTQQDDIIQNVFLKLLRGGLRNFKGSSRYEFLKYFKVIVINEARSYNISESRSGKTIHLDERINQQDNSYENEGLTIMDTICDPDKDSRPDCVLEDRDLLEEVSKIMATYQLLDQEIFLMKIKGYKDEEIKEILNIPLGTIASKYSRIRARILAEVDTK